MTCDVNLVFENAAGARNGPLEGVVVLESKTVGSESPIDHALHRLGSRPVSLSKYCVGMAVLDPGLPANRWNRELRAYFDWSPSRLDPLAHPGRPEQEPRFGGCRRFVRSLASIHRGDQVRCWGRNSRAVAVAAAMAVVTLGLAPGPAEAQAPVAAAVIAPGGTPWTWGGNSFGELGNGTTQANRVPGPVVGLSDVIDLHGGREHVIALRSDDTVWVWGSNGEGQLGLGGTANRSTPTQVPGLANVQAVETGHNLVPGADGRRHRPDLGAQRRRSARRRLDHAPAHSRHGGRAQQRHRDRGRPGHELRHPR